LTRRSDGLDSLWTMWQWLDRAPLGRNEGDLSWFHQHDEYPPGLVVPRASWNKSYQLALHPRRTTTRGERELRLFRAVYCLPTQYLDGGSGPPDEGSKK
jgi:hypothetical protein